MNRAIAKWRLNIVGDSDKLAAFSQRLEKAYVVYGVMVLLPAAAFRNFDTVNSLSGIQLQHLYQLIARELKVTHIAVAMAIPLHDGGKGVENIARAPSDFEPLYGDFGPADCGEPPMQSDFDAAFWVTAKQNGIYQTWAPRWTMFSRGNISEKARILSLPSVLEAIEQGGNDSQACAAVDLYVGIGYFAFSYLKAGVKRVLGWDLNPWSVEGLRRGATANKWACETPTTDNELLEATGREETRLIVFNESNEKAAWRIGQVRSRLPPIRHVNCGLLPSSKGSWETAVEVLDPNMGGWIHVHENFAVTEIGREAEKVRAAFQQMLNTRQQRARTAEIEHINRLKSYAPGVAHYVIDIYIPAFSVT